MIDRADFLARTLVARLRNLEERFAEDSRDAPDRGQRIAAIEKVLAIELGVTDGSTISLIEAAAPSAKSLQHQSSSDLSNFAEFLRVRLRDQLSAS